MKKIKHIPHIPELIYLQITEGEIADAENDFDNLNTEYTTWSKDRINGTDIEYRRNDVRKMIGLLYPDDYLSKQRIKLLTKSVGKQTKSNIKKLLGDAIKNIGEIGFVFTEDAKKGDLDFAELGTISGLMDELYKDMFGKSYYD
ncbi:MAG: hypothetical protein ACYCT7_09890 [bacterium]